MAAQMPDSQELRTCLIHSPPGQQPPAVSLELHHQVCDAQISLLLKVSKYSSSEEDLGLTNPEQSRIQLKGFDHLLTSFLAIHESLRDDIGCKEFISLPELLEGDPVGESLATDSDSFQDTIAPQLVKNKRSVDLSSLLLVVGNDTTDKVRVGVSECYHQLGELLLVQLGHGTEHALPGDTAKLGVCHSLLGHAHNLS